MQHNGVHKMQYFYFQLKI